MNEGVMTLGVAIETLKELFPNLNEEIILSALIQNHNNYEATLDALLFFNSNENSQKEKEISLFENQYISYTPSNLKDETFETPVRKSMGTSMTEQYNQNSYKTNKINKNEINRNSNVNSISENQFKEPVPKQEEKIEKKSFAQKFKCICFINNSVDG